MFFKPTLILSLLFVTANAFADVSFRPEVLNYFETGSKSQVTKRIPLAEAYRSQDYQKVLSQTDFVSDIRPDIKSLIVAESYYELKSTTALLDHVVSTLQKSVSLESKLFPLIEAAIADQSVYVSEKLKSRIKFLPESSLTKQALYLVNQDSKVSMKFLNGKISKDSPLEKYIIQAEVIEQFKKKNDQQVAKLSAQIKNQNLFLARLYYAQGNYEKAISIYEQINLKHPQFISSREELAWSYLMNKNLDASLGLTKDLLQSSVPASARLESRFLAAYSYLKSCHFEQVKTQMNLYQKEMQKISETVADGKKKSTWILGYVPNDLMLLNKQEQSLNDEVKLYQKNSKVLPLLTESLNSLRKEKTALTKLAYSNYEKLMAESVLKMQFLRLELLSLIHQIENKKIKTSEMLAENVSSKKSEMAKVSFAANEKEIWADEVFKTETSVNNLCGVTHE